MGVSGCVSGVDTVIVKAASSACCKCT